MVEIAKTTIVERIRSRSGSEATDTANDELPGQGLRHKRHIRPKGEVAGAHVVSVVYVVEDSVQKFPTAGCSAHEQGQALAKGSEEEREGVAPPPRIGAYSPLRGAYSVLTMYLAGPQYGYRSSMLKSLQVAPIFETLGAYRDRKQLIH
jgi:hypothetical protein